MNGTLNLESIHQRTNDYKDLKNWMAMFFAEIKPRNILELGTDVGDSTRIWSALLQKTGGQITTVDLRPPVDNWHELWPIKNIHFIQADTRELQWNQMVDLLYIDTDHTYQTTTIELAKFAPFVRPGGRIVCHDTMNKDMGPQVLGAVVEFSAREKLIFTQYPFQDGMAVIRVNCHIQPVQFLNPHAPKPPMTG